MVILDVLGGVEWLLLGTVWAGWLLGVEVPSESALCGSASSAEGAERFLLES